MDERRYDEDEVRQIFGTAADASLPDTSRAQSDGMTLAELQGIGAEVGLPPDRIAKAARALDARRGALPRRTQLGMPVSVGRVVDLPRAPTDSEWDLIVSRLRETFHARGKASGQGGIREWTHSNLYAFVEPSEDGYRLRLGTLNVSAVGLNTVGVVMGALAAAMLVMLVLDGRLSSDGAFVAFIAMLGGGAFLTNALRLPRWAREREAQMEQVAEWVVALLGPAPDDH